MKAVFLSTSTDDTEKLINSFSCAYPNGSGNPVIRYDTAGRQIDDDIVKEIRIQRPDIVVYISRLPPLDDTENRGGIPFNSTLREIRHISPSIHICCDAGDPPWHSAVLMYRDQKCFDLQVAIDGDPTWPLHDDENGLTALTPIDTRPFEQEIPRFCDRPVEFGFAGNVGSRHRQELATNLADAVGLKVNVRDIASYEEYCRRLMGFKISLNMPLSGTMARRHVKGRIIESAYAGCCVLEHSEATTSHWFVPGEDYATYDDEPDAAEKARTLMKDDVLAQSFADSLRIKVIESHSPRAFWDRVMDRL